MDKSHVSPFLFDIKRSEVNGPILQFQSTISEKEDVEKFVKTLNKVYDEGQLRDAHLSKAFEVWWPTLEQKLNNLRSVPDTDSKSNTQIEEKDSGDILEEILDLSRMNQKLLRSPDKDPSVMFSHLIQRIDDISVSVDREKHFRKRRLQRFSPNMITSMQINSPEFGGVIGFRLLLSLYKDEFPWIYDAGIELSKTLEGNSSKDNKNKKIKDFMKIISATISNPIAREMYGNDKSSYAFIREMPFIFDEVMKTFLNDFAYDHHG